MSEQMGIIRGIGFGLRDVGRPCIWFNVYLSEIVGSLQVIQGADEIMAFVSGAGAKNLLDLNDTPCWVEANEPAGGVKFLRLCKIPR